MPADRLEVPPSYVYVVVAVTPWTVGSVAYDLTLGLTPIYVENPWDVVEYRVPEAREAEVKDIRERIEQVSATSEYPATLSIWSPLLLGLVVPKPVQLRLASV